MNSEQRVGHIIDVIEDWYTIVLPPERVLKILAANPDFVADLDESLASGLSDRLDTSTREWFIDLVAKDVGMEAHWPLYGDPENYTYTFFATFEHRAKDAGIKLPPDFFERMVG